MKMEARSKFQVQNHHSNSNKQQPQQQPWPQHHRTSSMNKASSRNSDTSAHMESTNRFPSPEIFDNGDPNESPPYGSPVATFESKAIIPVSDKSTQCSPPVRQPLPRENRNHPGVGVSAAQPPVKKGASVGVGEEDGNAPAVKEIVWRSKARNMLKKAIMWSRVLEALLCMSSFAVMAADKTQGWSGDSFDRYREYRFCLSVNIIAFAYSSFQAYNSAYHLITGKHVIRHHLRRHFDFVVDQILSYLLLSAASAAATRVTDWETNWGKDEFTEMASASIALAFLGFGAFSFSSLLSAHSLWNRDFT